MYDEGGQIAARYTYNGATEYAGKQVTGNTFVVANEEMNLSPKLELGSTAFAAPESGGEERYVAETNTYAQTALSATAPKYPYGDLFPFPSHWTVYAGDCAENNPALVVTKETVTPGSAIVSPGARTEAVSVPESYVSLKVYGGTKKAPTAPTQQFEVKITNASCSKSPPASPNHAKSVSYTHTQLTSLAGELEAPFQPFGTLEICLKASATRHDLLTYQATSLSGSSPSLYTEELSASEKATNSRRRRSGGEDETRKRRSASTGKTRKRRSHRENDEGKRSIQQGHPRSDRKNRTRNLEN